MLHKTDCGFLDAFRINKYYLFAGAQKKGEIWDLIILKHIHTEKKQAFFSMF